MPLLSDEGVAVAGAGAEDILPTPYFFCLFHCWSGVDFLLGLGLFIIRRDLQQQRRIFADFASSLRPIFEQDDPDPVGDVMIGQGAQGQAVVIPGLVQVLLAIMPL